MRLLNIDILELEHFTNPPRYAILSHRWTGKELTYEQYCDPSSRQGASYEKIVDFCLFCRAFGNGKVQWVWVDTVCIDKRSSAELSEAINSMYRWYWSSAFCVAYLADVPSGLHGERTLEAVKHSEWFKRGWTLQELVAPDTVFFCNSEWEHIGDKGGDAAWCKILSTASNVPWHFLETRELIVRASIAERMSWASKRKTTRDEDMAYSLLGLFQVNMPLLYAEGKRAFSRLQREIIRHSNDESILAWKLPPGAGASAYLAKTGILAPRPDCFSESQNLHRLDRTPRGPWTITNKGLEMVAPLMQVQENLYLLRLNCVQTLAHWKHVTRMRSDDHRDEARGCMVPLVKRRDGSFWRGHINGFSGPVSGCATPYTEFETRNIEPQTIYIQTISRDVEWASLKQSIDIAAYVDVVEEDCLWDRSWKEHSWYDNVKAQKVLGD